MYTHPWVDEQITMHVYTPLCRGFEFQKCLAYPYFITLGINRTSLHILSLYIFLLVGLLLENFVSMALLFLCFIYNTTSWSMENVITRL